jgi:hypothetical protein
MILVGHFPHPTAGCQQGLGGYAAPVDTGSTHVAGFHDRHLQPVLRPMTGGIEAAIAGSDHDHIEIETLRGLGDWGRGRRLAHRS